MALGGTNDVVSVRVLKPGSGTKYPSSFTPTLEDLNKLDLSKAHIVAQWDQSIGAGAGGWHILALDNSYYYP